ncbi:MAG: carboxypeptidase M32 [Sphingobacteriales bacterium]|nr:MAG: carboxypeptidase M32 [Sphingobacteriales bacterium]
MENHLSDYEKYKALRQKTADLENILGLLSWDQEVYMPQEGAQFRAQQQATLSGVVHEMSTSPEYIKTLEKLYAAKDKFPFTERKNIEESYKSLQKNRKLPTDFIQRESKAISEAYQAWMKARQENNFQVFKPQLRTIISLQRDKAELLGYKDHPYNALLDLYEPEMTVTKVDVIFADVRKNLSVFFGKIKDKQQPDDSFFNTNFDKETQMQICRKLVEDLGYSWKSGRLDLSEHPFSISFNPLDARITTRINETDIRESIWGSIHETGHAFYELGLPTEHYGLPAGSPVSLSMHESQSRLWENNVGKSQAYISAYMQELKNAFPYAFGNVTDTQFFKGLNKVQPDLIRINSDEVTYHFHILLRYELEKDLIGGTLSVNDLEEAWNAKIKEYLGLDVPSPKMGVLQDIHWSHGSLGYFPTYSLGSFYAAQFYHFAEQAIPNLTEQIANKQFGDLLNWLRENVHRHGHTFSSEELCKNATGEVLDYKYFDDYLNKKYASVYGV